MNQNGKLFMRVNNTLRHNFFSAILLVSSTFLLHSCTKETTSDDDLTGNWKRSSEFEGVGRTEAVTFTIGDKVYVGGGYDGSDRLNDFWKFDQTSNTWTRVADFPGTARSSAVSFSINGKGYVGTGYDDNDNKLKDFWEYDPVTNTWTRRADFGGTARYNAVGFTLDNKGYIATGYDGNYLKDMWEYDPSTDTWVQKSSLGGSKRSDAVVFVHSGKAYILGGFNNGSYLNDFWVYTASSNSWSEKRKISTVNDDDDYDDDYGDNIRRGNGMIFVMNDKAYFTCGNRNGTLGTAWEYNISADTWNEKTGFEGTAREGGLGFSINNRGYITTGSNSSYRFDDMWEFFPDAEQSDNDN